MPSTPPHSAAAASPAPRLARLLRRASNAAALEQLLRGLGVTGEFPPLDRRTLVRAGLRPSVTRGVRSGGTAVPVYLAELSGEAGPGLIQQAARGFASLADGPFLFVLAPPRARTLVFGCRGADGGLRFAPVARLEPRAAELLLLEELSASPAGELARLVHWARVLDRGSVGVRFFRDIRAHRDSLARAWTGLPARAAAEREQLALLLLCRLLFLCFLQERGQLLGNREFLLGLVRNARGSAGGRLYDVVLKPLFFAVFNTRPERRSAAVSALGPLPYLNGGLFEPHALERRYPELSLPDDALLRTLTGLLDRYRFSSDDTAEVGEAAAFRSGIDPEVLGRVFEALMAAPRRGETGSFYTPPAVVDRLVTRALAYLLEGTAGCSQPEVERLLTAGDVVSPPAAGEALRSRLQQLRVLDPACGSGAFLLGALARLARARAALEPGRAPGELRQEIVGRALHGVDLLEDAALLCALRLWLALTPPRGEAVTPLPNLDRRIRQGDALLDPLDLLTPGAAAGPDRGAALAPEVRRVLRALEPLGQEYLRAGPETRPALRARLQEAEASLARSWLAGLRSRIERALREAEAAAGARDLWGEPLPAGAEAARALARHGQRLGEIAGLLRNLEDGGALPFFSFAVHFATASGFDLVLGNPPWVRAHRWPAALAGAVRTRFRVCREAGWPGAARLAGGSSPGGQVDLALLFLERGLDLLAERGTLAMLLPAKLLRSLFAGGARALLLERAAVLELDDHSLDQHSVFQADAFTVQVIARRTSPASAVRVTLRNRGRVPLEFTVPQSELSLVPGDPRSPWLLAPPEVLRVLRRMQHQAPLLGLAPGIVLRRGVITGANDVLVVPAAEHKLGGLSRIRAQGWFRARRSGDGSACDAFAGVIETECLRPLLRGADVKAWRWTSAQRVIWVPANDRPGMPTPPRTARYLARHAAVLGRRAGLGSAGQDGRVLRPGVASARAKVVWQDIAEDLHATALPAGVRGDAGQVVPVIPLNTVYFLAVPDGRAAHVLAALLNSLPLRVFARAAAERAKDARFRFFAWTIAALPLPVSWRETTLARELEEFSVAAHEAGGVDAPGQQHLDECVARAFRLDSEELDALREFDKWLKR